MCSQIRERVCMGVGGHMAMKALIECAKRNTIMLGLRTRPTY